MIDTNTHAGECIWIQINEVIAEIWTLIEIIFEQDELVKRAKQAIAYVKKYLGSKTRRAHALIMVLNSKTKDELEEYDIEDMIEIILGVRRVITKNNLMFQLENKCHNLK